MIHFNILRKVIIGEVTRLTWPQMTCMKNPRYTKCEYSGACYFLNVSASAKDCLSLTMLQSFDILWPCGGLHWWHHRSVAWPDLKINKIHNVWLEWGVRHEKFQFFIAKSSGVIAKTLFGGGTNPPPAGNASLCVTVGVRLHVRTCKASNVPRARAMFQISRTSGPIALKLGILMGIS